MIKKISILLLAVLCSCTNTAKEHIIVVKAEVIKRGEYKYMYELDFNLTNQILYSNTLYQVGDTINFSNHD